MRIRFKFFRAACAIIAAISIIPAWASVVINGTRVIFPSDEREVTVRMTNEGASPGLVQMWIDKGDPKSTPAAEDVPFLLTPPLFRIDPAKGQTVRMIYNKAPLPQDHESIFYLNLLEVPPRPQGIDPNDANYVQMAFRTRIKIFFRPKNLNSQDALFAAPPKVTWKLIRDGNSYVLEGKNPTPYHISVTRAAFVAPGDTPETEPKVVNEEGGMMPPNGQFRYVLKNVSQAPQQGTKVRFTYLNDYGGSVDVNSDIVQ
ncbi:P pilus assembly protein, chaperone PapD [Herbaspirillum sp. CF444]|uniref:fimbrial biogenesis chaperone n=1 Tax=Herbaspirillum sp. CF444 TaxID=1144319 RepID=UPI0002724083|nr:fimbria/pilus periplasmic chaperone [Herbaspirillum sp. CF444]EJL83496.1 P pilus assembly protein, chaperone PapD [Herbaspirillum sp. CF444]